MDIRVVNEAAENKWVFTTGGKNNRGDESVSVNHVAWKQSCKCGRGLTHRRL